MHKAQIMTFRFLLGISIAGMLAYYLLVGDNFLQTSIASILHHAKLLTDKQHFLILFFLPIYIGSILFGSIWLVAYMTNTMERFVSYLCSSKS